MQRNSENYKDEGKHSKIVSNKHFIHDIEIHHPLSIKYKPYWREIKRRCMEGYWFEGKWMPGPLYFFINLTKIRLSKSAFSTTKVVARPWLRDLEWEKAYVFMEARGFSGFQDDTEYTCWNPLKDYHLLSVEDRAYIDMMAPPESKKPDGTYKTYISARVYLRKIHSKNLGKPLFQNEARNVIDIECRGGGKDLQADTLVYGIDGPYPIKDVKVGDRIFGGDGIPTTVISRKDFFDQLQYRVTFSDGRSIECGGGHLWTVTDRGKIKTLTLDEIRKHYFYTRSTGVKDYRYGIPITKPVNFKRKDPNIDPYYLGLWLGDGNSHNTGITTMDKEIVDYLSKNISSEKLTTLNKSIKVGNKASTYTLTNGVKGSKEKYSNQLKNKLRGLGVLNNKQIPDSILYSSVDFRLKVLQGLMDSDGYVGHNGQYEISTSYSGLKRTIPMLLGGLGIKYTLITKGNALRIRFLTDMDVVTLPRKVNKVKKATSKYAKFNKQFVKIVDIQPTKVDHSVCIAVDNKDSLFIAGDYVVTHNSFWMANGIVLHTFLMDGLYDYDLYTESFNNGEQYSADIIVGAIDGKYTKDLLDKVNLGMSNLIGEDERGGKYYPSPLLKKTTGSWYSGKQYVENKYQVKVRGEWKERGSGSKIHNRSFKDDPFAGNGQRTPVAVIEEVGFFNILTEALGHMKDTTYDGIRKFGTIYMAGCVCAGTKVWTADGRHINIEDLQQKDGIIGYTGKGISSEPIIWMKPPAKKECVKITTSGGHEILCSIDHPLLWSKNRYCIDRGKQGLQKKVTFKRADELEVGDQLMMVSEVPIFNKGIAWEPRLLGLLVGDGYYGGSTVDLAVDNEDVFNWLNSKFRVTVRKTIKTKKGEIYRYVSILGIQEEMRKAGLMGQSKGLKTLPVNMHSFDMSSICEFIGGYYDADGCVTYNAKKNTIRITLTSKYKHLLEGVQSLLLKLGISSYISKEYRKRGFKPGEIYRLYITKNRDVNRFKQHITLHNKKKQEVLDSVSNINKRERGYYDNCHFKKSTTNKGSFYLRNQGLNNLKSERITSIVSIGEQEVYNLNAGLTHTYISNGFVSGNTGGDMGGGSSEAAMQVFFNPEEYDCLVFENVWEEGADIGFFVPYELGLNQFKDSEGITDMDRASAFVDKKRENLNKGKSKSALYMEMQNNPRVPSEAFLIVNSNLFPIGELKEHLNWLKSKQSDMAVRGQCGELLYIPDEDGSVRLEWKPDLKNKLEPCRFRMKKTEDTTGCIQIWEHPITFGGTKPPYGLYIAGTDPYDQDSAESTTSLGSTFIYKTFHTESGIYEWPVAEYTARPDTAEAHHENIRKLLMYYNAQTLYENERNTLKMHLSHKHSLYLLARTPNILKATANSNVDRGYGIHMTKHIKSELEIYTRDWLKEPAGDGTLNLHKIRSIPLLEELIYYNDTGNFDRVIAFMLVILHRHQIHHIKVEEARTEHSTKDSFINRVNKFFR